ncbi:MAG: hypothetical protein LBR70_06265 [Lactobacillaceae bacterium]|jgi:acyl-ACP thioesterase|nr:hypothetical protein [Lactobacillaceae bacterium]
MKTFQTLDDFLKESKDLTPNLLFQMSYELNSQEFDCKGFLHISSLMRLFQLVAQKDMHSNGHDVMKDIENGHQWMVRYYQVSIERFPNPLEKIKVYSWVSQMERLHATRNFLITQGDQVISKAASQWFIVNQKVKKFEPMPETYKSNIWDMNLLDVDIKKVSDLQNTFTRESRVAYHMIDSNQHMNNSYYPLLAAEAVEPKFRLSHVPHDFQIYFRKEVKFDETIKVLTELKEGPETVHSLRTDKEELSQIIIKWRAI